MSASGGWTLSFSLRMIFDASNCSSPLQSRPLDADGGIVPHDAALVVGMVGVVDFVAEHRSV